MRGFVVRQPAKVTRKSLQHKSNVFLYNIIQKKKKNPSVLIVILNVSAILL